MSLSLSLDQILESIKAWDVLRKSIDSNGILQLTDLFRQGNMFAFNVKKAETNSSNSDPEFIHTHLGYHDNALIFIIISSAFDNEETYTLPHDKILDYISVVPLETNLNNGISTDPNNEIPKEEAENRINSWKQHFATWISQTISTNGSIYQIMNVPGDDIISGEEHRAYFALTSTGEGTEKKYHPDLIIENIDANGHTTYDDTVCPIPPFGTDENAASKFYILSQALID